MIVLQKLQLASPFLTYLRLMIAIGIAVILACVSIYSGISSALMARSTTRVMVELERSILSSQSDLYRDDNLMDFSESGMINFVQLVVEQQGMIIFDLAEEPNGMSEVRLSLGGRFNALTNVMERLQVAGFIIGEYAIHPNSEKIGGLIADIRITAPAYVSNENYARAHEVLGRWAATPFLGRRPHKIEYNDQEAWDVSELYKLSGIGVLGHARIATIDGLDYRVADIFGKWRIVDVGKQVVVLRNETGANNLGILRFRFPAGQ